VLGDPSLEEAVTFNNQRRHLAAEMAALQRTLVLPPAALPCACAVPCLVRAACVLARPDCAPVVALAM
jgi:hypothetical protein